jgi:hypothetical protein
MFTPDEIRERVAAMPFVPVLILTSGGPTYDVFHPDLIMIGRRSITVGTTSSDRSWQYEHVSRIAILHITAIEDLPIPRLQEGNGQP